MLTLTKACQDVIDSVRALAGHNHPSMFLILVQSRTGMTTDYIHSRLKDWALGRYVTPERKQIVEMILLEALNVQSEAIHGIDWEALCGVDYKHQVKLLMGDM